VPGRDAGHPQRRAASAGQLNVLPVLQCPDRAAEPLPSGGGGEHQRRGTQVAASLAVEVVGVLVMGEQHRIDRAHLVWGHQGTDRLAQYPVADWVAAGRVERRVSQQPQPAQLQQCRWATQVAQGHLCLVAAHHDRSSRTCPRLFRVPQRIPRSWRGTGARTASSARSADMRGIGREV
jgi:hypothetical protein